MSFYIFVHSTEMIEILLHKHPLLFARDVNDEMGKKSLVIRETASPKHYFVVRGLDNLKLYCLTNHVYMRTPKAPLEFPLSSEEDEKPKRSSSLWCSCFYA